MPGIGTIHGRCTSSQASATWPGVAPSLRPTPARTSTRARFAARASAANRGSAARKSPSAKVVSRSIAPSEEALPERAVRHEPDPELLEGAQELRLGPAPPERVLVLGRRERLDRVGAAHRGRGRLGQAEVADLAGSDQVANGAGHILDRHRGVDPVLIHEVDAVGAQPAQRSLDGLADVFWAAVEAAERLAARGVHREPELGGDDHLVPDRLERLADQLLVDERAVDLGGVEEGDAALGRARG